MTTPPSDSQSSRLAKGMVDAIRTVLAPITKRLATVEIGFERHKESAATVEQLGMLVKRVNDLEGQMRKLEAKAAEQKYVGTWTRGQFKEGNTAVRHGSLWLCVRDCGEDEEPGNSDCWRLVAKKGRDAPRYNSGERSFRT